MKSLFDSTGNTEIIARINSLTKYSKAEWGKMNVAQMLKHCQEPLNVALGELKLKRGLIGLLFGKMIVKKLSGNASFDKNLPTHKNFLVKDVRNFDEEKNKLIELVKRFGKTNPEEIANNSHPIFGKITIQQWDMLQWKHLDHHLNQFSS